MSKADKTKVEKVMTSAATRLREVLAFPTRLDIISPRMTPDIQTPAT